MLLLWILLVMVLVWIFYPKQVSVTPGLKRFKEFESRVHVYSGLDPETWDRFLVHLRHADDTVDTDPTTSATFLYLAIDDVYDLSMATTDDEHQGSLMSIASAIARVGEQAIVQSATSLGVVFSPKYLNETLPGDTDEVRDTRRMLARDYRLYEDTLGTSSTGAGAI